VDADGYFTSDFNEKAGIPKDFRIRAADMQKFVESQKQSIFATHTGIDIAKTFGNAYKLFSQLVTDSPKYGENFSKEQINALPKAFEFDTKTFEVNQTFNTTLDKLLSQGFQVDKNHQIGQTFVNTPSDSLSKGDALLAFLEGSDSNLFKVPLTSSLMDGDTTILGKLLGYDNNLSEGEIRSFVSFMNVNAMQSVLGGSSGWGGILADRIMLNMQATTARSWDMNGKLVQTAQTLAEEYESMINSDMSLEEFKEKYLAFKKRYDEFAEEFNAAYQDKLSAKPLPKDSLIGNLQEEHEENQKPFKPIQGESDNTETYQDEFKKTFFERFLKAEQEKGNDITEILEQLSKIGYKFSG
ncbi:hypothetical protein CCZ01_04010, partial [Helicobacter monodelphidis]|uniref:Cj0814 family flagellar-dependent secreted protein n=1 Tax=Helicobacter sp. 15-1451 TaxID=2004995 RepID=UPI000DCC2513